MTAQSTLSPSDFEFVKNLVMKEAAIVLSTGKEYLAQSRLDPVARAGGFDSIGALVSALRKDNTGKLKSEVIDAMTTNETLFYRDIHPFDDFRQVIMPDLIEKRAGTKTLNFWCGAASTGQEPYSFLMLLKENFPELASWRIRFIATDISLTALERAKAGTYSQMEVNRGLPMKLLVKYFTKNGMNWQINEEMRRSVEFRPLNLAGNLMGISDMDVVFLRNVLIYFDQQTKEDIVAKVGRVLRPDGYLVMGSTESLLSVKTNFQRVQSGKSTHYQLSSPLA